MHNIPLQWTSLYQGFPIRRDVPLEGISLDNLEGFHWRSTPGAGSTG